MLFSLQEPVSAFQATRQKHETKKTLELEKNKTPNLTQQAAAAATQRSEAQDKMHKQILAAKQKTNAPKTTTTKKTAATKRQQLPKETTRKRQATGKDPAVVGAPQPPAEKQGIRKVPTATDAHGCTHFGLMDLKPLDRVHLTLFVAANGWLDKKPCTDCNRMDKDDPDYTDRVLEMKQLLTKGNKEFGHYCNCGPRAHTMSADDESKPDYTCGLVLCPPCHTKRETKRCESGGNRRSRAASQK